MTAGGSAHQESIRSGDIAAKLEAKAASARRRAEAFAKGEEGERLLAGALARLSVDGYHLLHDRRAPVIGGNIDHLVIGPAGVLILNAKHWATQPTIKNDTLWAGRYRKDDVLARASSESATVREALAQAHLVSPVRTALVFTNGLPSDTPETVKDVLVVSLGGIEDTVRNLPQALGGREVDAVLAALLPALPSADKPATGEVSRPSVAAFEGAAQAAGLPVPETLDQRYVRRYVKTWRKGGQTRLYVSGADGIEVGWKNATTGETHREPDCVHPRFTQALLDGVRPDGIGAVVLPEVVPGKTFRRRLFNAVADLHVDLIVGRQWTGRGQRRLYVHVLAAKQAPIDLGYVDLNIGKLHPVHALPGRSSTPAHLITYAWMGLGTA